MVRLTTLLTTTFLSLTNAHFLLNYPTTAGFSDDNEGIAPCGGFAVSYTNATDWHVGGDAVALLSTHPAAVWLLRATLDQTAAGNYTNLRPAISQTKLGAFCETGLTVPSSWAGSRGVIQIVQDATDGLLYQCAPVNFVSGASTSVPSTCTNATDLTASYTQASVLSAIPSATAAAASAASSATSTSAAASAASATPTRSAASTEYAFGSVFWAATALMGATLVGGL